MKKINSIVAGIALLATLLGCHASAQGECAWYIRRNGRCRPSIDIDQETLVRCGAYWIDETHTDECEEHVLYLTFDAGYINDSVISILDTLKGESVPAAFFILANPILKNTDTVIRMMEEGHTVCNHTKNHKSIAKMSKDELTKNLSDLDRLLEEKTGKQMSPYFRPPEGTYSEAALLEIKALGYTSVFWSFAYADWDESKQPSPKQAIKKVLSNTHNGAVILLHPTSKTNAEILPELIREWRAMGYRFGTLDELTRSRTPQGAS